MKEAAVSIERWFESTYRRRIADVLLDLDQSGLSAWALCETRDSLVKREQFRVAVTRCWFRVTSDDLVTCLQKLVCAFLPILRIHQNHLNPTQRRSPFTRFAGIDLRLCDCDCVVKRSLFIRYYGEDTSQGHGFPSVAASVLTIFRGGGSYSYLAASTRKFDVSILLAICSV